MHACEPFRKDWFSKRKLTLAVSVISGTMCSLVNYDSGEK